MRSSFCRETTRYVERIRERYASAGHADRLVRRGATAERVGCRLENHGRAGLLPARDARLVRAELRRADARAGAGLAGDRGRRTRPDPGADRLGEDARGIPLGDRPADRHAGTRPPRPLRLAAQGAQLRRRAEPARAARRSPVGAPRRRPHGRHAAEGARGDAPRAAGHPDHDAGVALPAAHVARARAAAQRRHADPRRGARRRRDEARRPSRALGRAARGARGAAAAADRPLGDAAPARGDRPLRLGWPADRARRRGRGEGARPRGRRPGRGHARAGW